MSTQPELELDCEEPEFNIVCCDLCGDDSLDGEAHSWLDQRKYREQKGESIYLATQEYTCDNGYVIMCESCREDYVYAEDAEALCHGDQAVYVDCRDAYFTEEYACDNFYRDENGYWNDEPQKSTCLDYSEDVLHHCTLPKRIGKRLVMGVELECEPRGHNSQADLVEAVDGPVGPYWICTEDGSLDDGMELNCLPFELAEHKSGNYVNWPKLLENLREVGKSGAGTTACGMHVHINRAALSPLVIGKMLVFANSERNEARLSAVFQRSDNEYAQASIKKITDVRKRYHARCERINLSPERTIEVRAFRGNLRTERVLKNLEFCHAMVTWCRECSMQHVEDWARFTAFVHRNKKDYGHLWAYLNERGIVT